MVSSKFNFEVVKNGILPRERGNTYEPLRTKIFEDLEKVNAGDVFRIPRALIPGGKFESLRSDIHREANRRKIPRPRTSTDGKFFYIKKVG